MAIINAQKGGSLSFLCKLWILHKLEDSSFLCVGCFYLKIKALLLHSYYYIFLILQHLPQNNSSVGTYGGNNCFYFLNVEWRIGSTHAFAAKVSTWVQSCSQTQDGNYWKLSSPFFQPTDFKTVNLFDVVTNLPKKKKKIEWTN